MWFNNKCCPYLPTLHLCGVCAMLLSIIAANDLRMTRYWGERAYKAKDTKECKCKSRAKGKMPKLYIS